VPESPPGALTPTKLLQQFRAHGEGYQAALASATAARAATVAAQNALASALVGVGILITAYNGERK
jgi:hypothetical protein